MLQAIKDWDVTADPDANGVDITAVRGILTIWNPPQMPPEIYIALFNKWDGKNPSPIFTKSIQYIILPQEACKIIVDKLVVNGYPKDTWSIDILEDVAKNRGCPADVLTKIIEVWKFNWRNPQVIRQVQNPNFPIELMNEISQKADEEERGGLQYGTNFSNLEMKMINNPKCPQKTRLMSKIKNGVADYRGNRKHILRRSNKQFDGSKDPRSSVPQFKDWIGK